MKADGGLAGFDAEVRTVGDTQTALRSGNVPSTGGGRNLPVDLW
jgi:hypothetical protein